MLKRIQKTLLVLGTVLAPLFALAQPNPACATCKAVPEGGSTVVYLVAMGVISAGALFLRRCLRKARAS